MSLRLPTPYLADFFWWRAFVDPDGCNRRVETDGRSAMGFDAEDVPKPQPEVPALDDTNLWYEEVAGTSKKPGLAGLLTARIESGAGLFYDFASLSMSGCVMFCAAACEESERDAHLVL